MLQMRKEQKASTTAMYMGVGMFLCELAIDQEIDKGYAKRLFSELPNTVKEQAASKYMARYIDLAYNKILQDVVCKEVFQ